MKGCDFSDLLPEVEFVISGTVHAAIHGKNYSRVMVSHKTMLDAMERLLFVVFLETKQ